MGQDPYPQPNVATGVAFAVKNGSKLQPSLKIMLDEIAQTEGNLAIGINDGFDTELKHWQEQGILLLNASLTCEAFQPMSHYSIWKPFMSAFVTRLNNLRYENDMNPLIFVFFGKAAQYYNQFVDSSNYIINAIHPAAEQHGSGNFVGCGVFRKINKILNDMKQVEVVWG